MCLVNQRSEIPEDINIFPVYYKGEPLTQRIALIRHKDRYLTGYAQFFLEQLIQYFNDAEQVPMARKCGKIVLRNR